MAAVPALRDQFAAARKGTQSQLTSILAMIAKEANAGIMRLEPRPAGFVRTVDGAVGAPEEAVKPDGLIVYDYQRLDIVVQFALDTLRTLSPHRSGAYQEAHTVMINHAAVSPPYAISPTDEVMIVNPEPYARKIEVGHMHMLVPGTDRVYQQAKQVIDRTYQELVETEFTYVDLPDAQNLAGRFSPGVQPQSRVRLQKDTRRGAAPQFPALIFHLR